MDRRTALDRLLGRDEVRGLLRDVEFCLNDRSLLRDEELPRLEGLVLAAASTTRMAEVAAFLELRLRLACQRFASVQVVPRRATGDWLPRFVASFPEEEGLPAVELKVNRAGNIEAALWTEVRT